MIATYAPTRTSSVLWKLTGYALVGCASLLAAILAVTLQDAAIANAIFLVLLLFAAWRPRYGVYAILLLAIAFDPSTNTTDTVARFGWYMQTPISASSDISVLIFSPIELLLVVTVLRTLIGAWVERRPLARAELQRPLLLFLGLVLLSILWGVATHGVFHIALWETRSLVAAILLALLVPSVFTNRGQVHHLINLLCVAVVILSIDVIWRRFTILANVTYLDLSFDHDTPIFMDFVIVLLTARLVWPATGRQRLAALLIPFIAYAQMVTERRAGWVSLDVGLILIAIFTFRLRRKVFYFVVLPLLVVYAGYLGAFWNATGTLAQPARAVRSINDPDQRDLASNLARMLERQNIRLNIRAHPLTGLGFGNQYTFYLWMPDASGWPLWHYVAHTQLLWLWMQMGPVGFLSRRGCQRSPHAARLQLRGHRPEQHSSDEPDGFHPGRDRRMGRPGPDEA